jgi:hypothetical protein
MKTYQYRDLSLIKFPHFHIITACDSSGGVGEKPNDVLHVPEKYVSMFATRVCLFEILSCGGKILSISNTVCCEMNPTGQDLIQGIKEELNHASIYDIMINGSTEENFPTSMTGFGIYVMGIADHLRISPSTSDNLIICIGTPKFGENLILEDDIEIVTYDDLKTLLSFKDVYEIVPCGSKGILYEAQNLANLNHLFLETEPTTLNIIDSAGPATVVIASINCNLFPKLQTIFGNKLTLIGTLKETI